MSLAADIAHQLHGRRSGKGWVIPAICHNPDSRKHNLLISDGYNGKLSAKCFSNDCDYQTIMQSLEACGAKPQDIFTPEARQQQKIIHRKQSRLEGLNTLSYELFIVQQHLNARIENHYRSIDRAYLNQHPEFKLMPTKLWGRESEATNNSIQLLEDYREQNN